MVMKPGLANGKSSGWLFCYGTWCVKQAALHPSSQHHSTGATGCQAFHPPVLFALYHHNFIRRQCWPRGWGATHHCLQYTLQNLLDFESVLQLTGNSSPSPPFLPPPHTPHLPTRAPQPGHQKAGDSSASLPGPGTATSGHLAQKKHSLSIRKHSHYQPGHQWSTLR